jgi:GlpG protein
VNDLGDPSPPSMLDKARLSALANPLVSVLLALSLVGYVFGSYSFPVPKMLLFGGLEDGHYWRLITPIFLHFGAPHLVFNALWLGLLGSKIERAVGSIQALMLIVAIAIASNVGQYLWTGSVRFGGMSGVIYGLLGYLWIHHSMFPRPIYALPRELVGFMLAWLLICMTGVLDFLLGVGIANAAHLCGLLAGMALGLIFGYVESHKRANRQ